MRARYDSIVYMATKNLDNKLTEEELLRRYFEKLAQLGEDMIEEGEKGGLNPVRIRRTIKKMYKLLA